MTIDTSLTVIAICLIVLVTFAVITLISLTILLFTLTKTTKTVKNKVDPLLDHAKKIVDNTTDTTEMIKENIELTKPLFRSIGKISTLFEGLPDRLKNEMHDNTVNFNFDKKKRKIDVAEWAEWASLGLSLIQKLRRK